MTARRRSGEEAGGTEGHSQALALSLRGAPRPQATRTFGDKHRGRVLLEDAA